jgi:hypothetical protein
VAVDPLEQDTLDLRGAEIERLTAFLALETFAQFGLPDELPA